jgi:hypothetical protein
MKKIRNDKSAYISRSTLVQSPAASKTKSQARPHKGDFKVDGAGYLIWQKSEKGSR